MGHYAVIEIGSNAVRMILGVKEDDSTVKVLRTWSSHFRLGQEVLHVHYHIIPRTARSSRMFGNRKNASTEELQKTAEQIRKFLS